MTLVIHHLVKILDKVKHDLHNRAPLHDMSADIKVLTNGIHGLKYTIGMYTVLEFRMKIFGSLFTRFLWSLILPSWQQSKKSIYYLNLRPKLYQHASLSPKLTMIEKTISDSQSGANVFNQSISDPPLEAKPFKH